MEKEVRLLVASDAEAAWELGSLAFGYRDRTMPPGWGADSPGRRSWGLFGGDGALLGKAVDREQSHWFGGRQVPASGVAGVAVAADRRGTGVGRAVMTRLLADARDRGAVISTLFNTTATPYRRLGFEEVGALVHTAVPTMLFAGFRAPTAVATRAATIADVARIEDIYRQVARDSTGMLERSGPVCGQTPEELLADWDGITVAVAADGVIGYASWDRGTGYDSSGRVTVGDLIGLTPEATIALLAMLGGWASVAPTLVFEQPEIEPISWLGPTTGEGRVEKRQPWMLRLLDAPGAVAARGWPPHLTGSVDLDIDDRECRWNAGRYRFVLAGGEARLEPGGPGGVILGPRGLALWYAGATTPAALRRAGLLTGDTSSDALLLAATAGPTPALLDYF